MKTCARVLAVAVMALLFSSTAHAQWSGPGGCPGAQRNGLPPCCSTFTVPTGGSDDDRTCVGPATRYSVNIHEFSFEDSLGTLHVLGSTQSFDAAAVDAGQTVGAFLSGASLPAGSYPYMRPIIDQDFVVSGDITTADSRRCVGTATGMQLDGSSPETCNADGINPNYAPNTQHENCVENGRMHIRDGQAPFVMTQGGSLSISFQFFVESGVKCVFPPGGAGDATLGVGGLMVNITSSGVQ